MADPEFLLLGDALWLEFVNTAAYPARTAGRAARRERLSPLDQGGPGGIARRSRGLRGGPALPRPAAGAGAGAGRGAEPAALRRSRPSTPGWRALDGREQLIRVGGRWRLRFAPVRPPARSRRWPSRRRRPWPIRCAMVRRCANPECGLFFADDSPQQRPPLVQPQPLRGPGPDRAAPRPAARRSSRRASPPGR